MKCTLDNGFRPTNLCYKSDITILELFLLKMHVHIWIIIGLHVLHKIRTVVISHFQSILQKTFAMVQNEVNNDMKLMDENMT